MNEEILDRYDEITDELMILKWWSDFRTEYLKGALVFCAGTFVLCFVYLIFLNNDALPNLGFLLVYFFFAVSISLFFIKMIRKLEVAHYRSSQQVFSRTKRKLLIITSVIVAIVSPVVLFFALIIAIIPKHC